jgi:hypothetical protein
MGVSTDAKLCYGISFEEGYEFPWMQEKYDHDIDAWWRDVNGFVNRMPCPWTDEGEYAEGVSQGDQVIDDYFQVQRKWDEEHPLPVEIVHHCSDECTMYIIAIPGTLQKAWSGDVTEIDPAYFFQSLGNQVDALIEFCKKYEIEITDTPKWLLCSYWG